MSLQGMDIESVRLLARQMHDASGELVQTAAQLNVAFENATWTGPDREQFAQRWAQWRAHIAHASDALRDAATTATRNADDQERASDGGGPIVLDVRMIV